MTGPDSLVYRLLPLLTLATLLMVSADATAHVSESGYVLLLPTQMYVNSGLIAVAATMILLLILPVAVTQYWSAPLRLTTHRKHSDVIYSAGLFSVMASLLLLYAGYYGNADPLRNALPLFFWTVFWVGMVLMQGLFGNVWQLINPWAGYHRLFHNTGDGYYRLPASIGVWPAAFLFLCFFAYYLADPAPDNPYRLAKVLSLYSALTITGIFVFGRYAWLSQCECFSVFMRLFSLLAPIGRYRGAICLGYPGWKIITYEKTSKSVAVFCLLALGSGSFDGVNETFWWLELNGINPLAYQGRSSTMINNITGLLGFNLALIFVFILCITIGQLLVFFWGDKVTNQAPTLMVQFSRMAMAVLPIAFAYHYAHFLTIFMINIQYVADLVVHPLHIARAYLDPVSIAAAQPHYVSAGFLANHETVKIIWLSQCIAVVCGHVISAMLTHSIAVKLYITRRNTVLSQLPVTAFMLAYTYLGLRLLASARL